MLIDGSTVAPRTAAEPRVHPVGRRLRACDRSKSPESSSTTSTGGRGKRPPRQGAAADRLPLPARGRRGPQSPTWSGGGNPARPATCSSACRARANRSTRTWTTTSWNGPAGRRPARCRAAPAPTRLAGEMLPPAPAWQAIGRSCAVDLGHHEPLRQGRPGHVAAGRPTLARSSPRAGWSRRSRLPAGSASLSATNGRRWSAAALIRRIPRRRMTATVTIDAALHGCQRPTTVRGRRSVREDDCRRGFARYLAGSTPHQVPPVGLVPLRQGGRHRSSTTPTPTSRGSSAARDRVTASRAADLQHPDRAAGRDAGADRRSHQTGPR